ncbi:MAG: alpha-2-macroglobulin family protein [Anaeromyxobacter sp.]
MTPAARRLLPLLTLLSLAPHPTAAAEPAAAADTGQRPEGGGVVLLPETFLRGYDPVTVHLDKDAGPGRGPADDGARRLQVVPAWPGAWSWVDKRTLQFRPAEPWPPLARFQVEAAGQRRVLTTMMSAPSSLSPADGSDDLRPFRAFTLTFPQPLPLDGLRRMLSLELRDAPGPGDGPVVRLSRFTLAQLPRGDQREAASYAVTLPEDVPEGRQLSVKVALALGQEGTQLWTGRLSTRPPFHLVKVRCGQAELPVVPGAAAPRDGALACGNQGERPQLHFSAPLRDPSLGDLKKLIQLEPAVPDLTFDAAGDRITLRGKLVPDVLYKLRLAAAPVKDESGRPLRDPGGVELYFYSGWKSPFLRWSRGSALVEARGPRMLPLTGYGDARADVRIYRIDPFHDGLWPFPDRPVEVNEEGAPPFPGEEPAAPDTAERRGPAELVAHLRLLGSPLVSKVVPLPLEKRAGTTSFGLDLGALLDPVVGKGRPGTYLVGLRRLVGPPQRTYVRVQVTNLTLTTVEERDRAVFFVRTLDRAEPVQGARIRIEGKRVEEVSRGGHTTKEERPAKVEATTDAGGRAAVGRLQDWTQVLRVSVQQGEDVLVLDPGEAQPQFADAHWSTSGRWLRWLTQNPPPPANDKTFAFLFTDRAIYRPGEAVQLKGYLRRKVAGGLVFPGGEGLALRVDGPDGRSIPLPLAFTALGGFSAELKEADLPSGRFSAVLFDKKSGDALGERTFQIEAYRIPTFEVQLSSPLAVPLDRPFKVKGVARYYAGGAGAGLPVSWTVTQRPYFHTPAGREGFLFASAAQFARPDSARPAPVVRRASKLDPAGADQITVDPSRDLDGTPRIYHLEATVTGPDQQQVSAALEVKGLPPFLLGMKLARYQEKATELRPEILAIGPDDKPVLGQEVVVRVYRRLWRSQLRETPFATGQARYLTEQEDVKVAEKRIKTEAGPVTAAFPISEAGVYVVELTGRDRLGRVQTLSADLYAGGPGPVAWQKPREGIIQLTPDRPSHAPGQTARVVIESPVQTGRALVIVEEPVGNVYRWLDVSGGKAVAELPVEARHVPNLPVHAVVLRGRLGEGTQDDGRYRPLTVAGSLDLKVEPVQNQVRVVVKHPESVRPGARVELELTLSDEAKRPLAGEVTLWLVDAAVLSLAREGPLDPLSRFIEPNRRATTVRDTRNLAVGRVLELEEEPGGDGEELSAEARVGGVAQRPVVRKNFKTVPFYQATLQVPASGRLVVPVTLSDDLTDFRVRAVAASGTARFGLHQSTLRVRLPVLIQPQLPRLVRSGDRFWPGGVARVLEGAGGAGTVSIQVNGQAAQAKQSVPVQLSPEQPVSGLTPVTVAAVPGSSELTVQVGVTRAADGVGDAFEVKIPVQPDRTVERFAYVERLAPGPVTLRPFPEAPRPGTVRQDVALTSVPGVLELISGVDYLDAYPHECLEQRAARVWARVGLAGVLSRLGLPGPDAQAQAAARRLLADLPLHQDEAGLLAYWPGNKGDVALTAQVLELLRALRAAGLPVDEKVEKRAGEALAKALRSDYPGAWRGFEPNQRTAALAALSRTGHLDEHYAVDLFQARAGMDATSVADLAAAMNGRPDLYRTNLAALKEQLWSTVVFKLRDGKPVFDGLRWGRNGWGGGYLGSDASAVAAVWRSLLLLDPTDPRQAQLRDGLLSYARPDRGFGDAHATRRGLEALATYLDLPQPQLPASSLKLTGQAALDVDGTRKVGALTARGEAPLSGKLEGAPAGVRVAYAYVPAAPGDRVAATAQGLSVARSSSAVAQDGTLAPERPDQAGEVRTLAVGDVLELHTRVTSAEERFHVALVVPFAGGLELLNPALQTTGAIGTPSQADTLAPTAVQRLDGELRYYFDRLPAGTQSFHFRVRASSEGSFVQPAPFAELMYRQEVRGRGAGLRVRITGEHEK